MVVIFFIPGHSESPALPCRAYNIDFAFKQVPCRPIQYGYLSHHFLRIFYTFQTHYYYYCYYHHHRHYYYYFDAFLRICVHLFKSYMRNLAHVKAYKARSLRKQPFFLAPLLGTFRKERRLRLSDINSILMA